MHLPFHRYINVITNYDTLTMDMLADTWKIHPHVSRNRTCSGQFGMDMYCFIKKNSSVFLSRQDNGYHRLKIETLSRQDSGYHRLKTETLANKADKESNGATRHHTICVTGDVNDRCQSFKMLHQQTFHMIDYYRYQMSDTDNFI